MGHASFQTIKRILHHCNIFANTTSSFCDSCAVSKIHQLPYVPSQTQYMHPLESMYMDIWGPSHVCSINGDRYYLSFVDAYSKYTWIYLLHAKSQVLDVFRKYKLFVENQFDCKIKAL